MAKAPREPGLDQFQRAASKLRPIEREVLFLRAGERLGYEDIAARLGISVAEVEGHLADALYHLELHLERQERPWWRFW